MLRLYWLGGFVFCKKIDLIIKNNKGVKVFVTDHLFRLEFNDFTDNSSIQDDFLNEHMFTMRQVPWYVHIINNLLSNEVLSYWNVQNRWKFLDEIRNIYLDDSYLFNYCPYQIMRFHIPKGEISSVLDFFLSNYI